jgi:hypothetical protein
MQAAGVPFLIIRVEVEHGHRHTEYLVRQVCDYQQWNVRVKA